VAVAGVLIFHFYPHPAVLWFEPGGIGVHAFFVLSGYLITRILLQYRDLQIGTAAKTFYSRRLLRLSPAYYTAIAAALILDIAQMRSDWWIHALYLTNFYVAKTDQWGWATHF